MKFRLCLMTGIFGIAVIAGVFEALNSLRGKEEPKEKSLDDIILDFLSQEQKEREHKK